MRLLEYIYVQYIIGALQMHWMMMTMMMIPVLFETRRTNSVCGTLHSFRQLQVSSDSRQTELHNEMKLKCFEADRTQLVHEETCRVLKQTQLDAEKLNSKLDVRLIAAILRAIFCLLLLYFFLSTNFLMYSYVQNHSCRCIYIVFYLSHVK